MHRSAILFSTAAAVAMTGAAARAATTPSQPAPIAEVIVTAQKREQKLQDVPIVVTVVNAQQVKDAGVRDIRDLTILAPGLTVTATTSESSTTARIRGVGTVGDNPGLESSVGVVIDGVYRPRNGVGFGDLGDISRIEVLKGPQGTLFGKSTSAGVINIVTAVPSFTFGSNLEATVGDHGAYGGSASITGPISGQAIAGSLYVAARKRDGFTTVRTGAGPRSQTDDMDQNYYTVRAQALLRPNDDVTFRLIGDYAHRDENCCAAVQLSVGSSPASRAVLVNAVRPGTVAGVADPFARIAYSNRSTANLVTDKGVSAQGDVKLGWADLTSITAYRSWRSVRGQDSDFTALDILYRPEGQYTDQFDTFSQELRLAGHTDRVDWLAGGFFANEVYHGLAPQLYGSDYYSFVAQKVLGGAPALIGLLPSNSMMPGAGQRDSFKQTDRTWALFTNDTVKLTDAWDVTVGLRYTSDRKTLDSLFTTTGGTCSQGLAAFAPLAGAVGASNASTIVGALCLPWATQAFDARSGRQTANEDQSSGTIKTSYRLTPGVMAYASYARGYKAGGFNFDRAAQAFAPGPAGLVMTIMPSTHFAPETVDAWEVGAKTAWLDRSLTLNLAYFDQKYENFQLNTFLGTSFVVESIPRVTSRGVDVDLAWRTPAPGLTFQGGVTYARTEYGRFTAAQLTVPERFASLSRLPGQRLSFAPLWSASGTVGYEHAIGTNLVGRGSISAKYMSSYNTGSDLAPQKAQDAFTLVNARIGIGPDDQRWSLEAWSQNLTNVKYIQVAFNGPLQGTESNPASIRTYDAFLGATRTYGLTLRMRY